MTNKSRHPQHIRQDFLDAIERLRLRQPQNQELRSRVNRGRSVTINVSTVAKEAGRARSLIARDDSPYPDIRHRIRLEAGTVRDAPRNSDDVITDLRAQVADLRTELKQVKELTAYHLERRQKAEREAQEYKDTSERSRAENARLKRQLADAQKGNRVVSIDGTVKHDGSND
ncbi:MAG: hypothetical protein U5K73_04705 [Halofilum sp. (in: g-proteobacteria)]|nr:hypothetical protein [Halofilum sp. (in: g-proteobacteria)]